MYKQFTDVHIKLKSVEVTNLGLNSEMNHLFP